MEEEPPTSSELVAQLEEGATRDDNVAALLVIDALLTARAQGDFSDEIGEAAAAAVVMPFVRGHALHLQVKLEALEGWLDDRAAARDDPPPRVALHAVELARLAETLRRPHLALLAHGVLSGD